MNLQINQADSKKTLQNILHDENLNLSANPKGTDKGDFKSYIDLFYSKHFEAYRHKKINLLEIGFRHGASLALWSSFFEDAKITGVDNLSDSALGDSSRPVEDWVARKNVEILVGDAYSEDFANSVSGKYDIIIDDGPHWLSTQQAAIDLYLLKLKPGGLFVIEDLLTGGLTIFPLLGRVPLRYACYFYDFRLNKLTRDNCLFVIRPSESAIFAIFSRIKIILIGVLYFFLECSISLCKRICRFF